MSFFKGIDGASEHPGRELLAYTTSGVAFVIAIYGLSLPQPVITLWIIPLPFLALRWPRWALSIALALVFAGGVALALLVATDPVAEVRLVALQAFALAAMIALVVRLVASRTATLASLASAEARHRVLVESLNAIPFEVDLATDLFLYVGPQVEQVLGCPASELIDFDSWAAMLHPDDREEAIRFCRDAAAKGEDHEFEYRMLVAGRPEVWIHDVVAVAKEAGRPAFLRGVMIDVTEKHRAAEERDRLEHRALEAQRLESLGILAGGVAHDFNNLLTPILANVSNVLETATLPESVRAQLRDAEVAAEAAADIAQQMLAYAGRSRSALSAEDLSHIVADTVRLLSAGISKQAALELELAEGPIWVRGEVAQLRQVVMNVLANAVDAVEATGGTVFVKTFVEASESRELGERVTGPPLPPGPCAVLAIHDDGVGMDEEMRRQMFDPFFSAKPSGHGLGMAAVLGIIQSHGGAIDVTSAPGTGTCVKVSLPLCEAPRTSEQSAVSARTAAPDGTSCVLVVDDEPAIRRAVRYALEDKGFRVVEAGDGEEALAVVRPAPNAFAAVVLDMTMPRLSGRETLSVLRQRAPDLPVLLMSGYSEAECSPEAGTNVGFIAKPFRARELQAHLSELLARQGSEPPALD